MTQVHYVEFSEANPGTVNLDDFASGAGVLSNGTFDGATKYSATFTPKISIEAEGQVIILKQLERFSRKLGGCAC